ncbi:peptidoglycan-binding protein [Streptomyces violascens]|uniref:peptidoglycan-binding protein n=1 Tax=Streptomyces violascens TaxID=67381 RepID=UPI001E5753A9|nr:peptidoglycan-binding protein [Streptomyces violascens]
MITAPVVRQVMKSTVVLRGTFSDGQTVSATPTQVAATKPGTQSAALVVTGVFAQPGQRVKAAQPLLEYAERPVFALPGNVPMYRDLVVGEEGKDVAQLQQALETLGYSTGSDTTGHFGAGTASAVTRMYKHMGYAVPVSADTPGKAADTATPGGTGGPQQNKGLAAHATAPAVVVPASEVVYVPVFPARVATVPVRVGDVVKGPVITLARGDMTLTGHLDPSERGLISTGMTADIFSEATGVHTTGTVGSVGSLVTPGDKNAKDPSGTGDAASAGGAAYLPLTVKGNKPWDARFAGQDVRITLTAATTTEPVLAVPQAAIVARADAKTTVSVLEPSGKQRAVPVTTGVSADGLVQISPDHGSSLAPGDRVVVGT